MSLPIYVIGHKNPDTDSICAALALAELKRQTGINATAARLGTLNPETKFILDKLHVNMPVLLTTARSTLEEIEIDDAVTIEEGQTIRRAWDLCLENHVKTLYVVDDKNEYKGMVTLGDVSKVQMQDLNITSELLKETPLENLVASVKGSFILKGNLERSGFVRIADKRLMDRDLKGAIMVLNDHEDSMIKSMAKGCAVIVVAENFVPNSYIIEMAKQMGVTLTDLETVLKNADFITIHVPLTPETKHLISDKEFEIMKDTAFIANCARGGIIDEKALYTALSENKIGGCALDVYEEEPPAEDSKLFELDNIVLTPHIAASTKEAQRDAAIIVADEIIELANGGTPQNVLNMPRIDTNTYKKLTPYVELCEKLGSFISQAVNGKIQELEVVYAGKLGEIDNIEILTRTILQGVINPFLSSPVNAVNAPLIAKERGISIIEGKRDNANGYGSLIKVTAKTNKETFSAEGTTLHDPRILKVNDYWVDVKPEGHIAKYEDIPGSIGKIGTKLGEHGVNIGIMQVGREEKNGKAIMILTLDKEIPKSVIKEIQELDNVYEAVGLEL